MHNITLALGGAGKVLLYGLLLGAGLPALFAVGMRALSWGTGHGEQGGTATATATAPHPAGRVVAVLCFAVVVAVALTGVAFIIASGLGKTLSFEHVVPTFVDK